MNKKQTTLEQDYIEWVSYVVETKDDITEIINKFPAESMRSGLMEFKEFHKCINTIRRRGKIKQIQKKLIK